MFVLLPQNKTLNLGAICRAEFTEEPRQLKMAMADGETLVVTNHIALGLWALIQNATMFSVNDKGEIGQKVAKQPAQGIVLGTAVPPPGTPLRSG